MIKYIFFDFDGTIADTMPYTLKELFRMLSEEKISLSKKEILSDLKSLNFIDLMKKWKVSPLRFPFIIGKINKSLANLYFEIDQIKIFPGMEKLFIDLKKRGYKLGIISSNIQKNVDKFLEINKLNYFDMIWCNPSFLKKDQSMRKLFKKYNLKTEEMIYVGDEIRDIVASHKVGIKMIGVPWGLHDIKVLKANGADLIINKPGEIYRVLVG